MLREFRIENLLLIESADLNLAPGLNVLTGETGAGKTLLATALGLLLGDRSRSGLVRPGAEEAYVEGVFDLPENLDDDLRGLLPEGSSEIVLARRIWPDGRSRAQICGRTATVADLRMLAGALFSFYGQHEHRRLALASFQLDALDRAAGEQQMELRRLALAEHQSVGESARHLERLSGVTSDGGREADLLRFELDEIEILNADPSEVDELDRTLKKLRSAEDLKRAAAAAVSALQPEDDFGGAISLVSNASGALDLVSGVDGELDGLSERLRSAAIELDDIARDLRSHSEVGDAQPGELARLEARREQIARLERKHGGSITAVMSHAEQCRVRLGELEAMGSSIKDAEKARDAASKRLSQISKRLNEARVAAAPQLAAEVQAALVDLALEGASFEIKIEALEDPTSTGSDRVEFLVAANQGINPGPLGEVASGGEVSRILLALLTVTHADERLGQRLLVFDEIDAGIGGLTARAVGERLRSLSSGAQVICITHLPQVAVLAERHFTITKQPANGSTVTSVAQISKDGLIDELVRMLGSDSSDSAARAHAVELIKAA